jgi:translation initiation factor 2 beta subunit (eIF-2beta)/eIF-5
LIFKKNGWEYRQTVPAVNRKKNMTKLVNFRKIEKVLQSDEFKNITIELKSQRITFVKNGEPKSVKKYLVNYLEAGQAKRGYMTTDYLSALKERKRIIQNF